MSDFTPIVCPLSRVAPIEGADRIRRGIWTRSQRFWYDTDLRPDFIAGKNLQRCRVVALDIAGCETASEIESLVERFKASQVPA